MSKRLIVFVLFGLVGCGSSQKAAPAPAAGGGGAGGGGAAAAAAADPGAVYGPLEVGSDWASYHKVSTEKWVSKTHGGRYVEVYVNDVGFEAYTSDDKAFPVGTVLVKPSWEAGPGGEATDQQGPVFVMEKREAGYSPDHDDWYYAIHWEHPVGKLAAQLKGPFYWRSPSAKVNYCWKCHDNYDRSVGLPPVDHRAWKAE